MARLVVLYRTPTDAAAFGKYYAETHVSIAKKLPGLNGRTKRVRDLILAGTCVLFLLSASPAFASDASDLNVIVKKFVTDINKGDFRSVVAACAPRTSIVDGFPPYAWQTCADWMKGYESNNKAIQATLGSLSIGKPVYTEVRGNHAYLIYPVTFADTQKGKQVSYKGSMTVTLQKTPSGWVFTGAASAWSANSL